VLPIRLNIDQDALLFLHQFFADISSKAEAEGMQIQIATKPFHVPKS
jgi:hypothetical protein